MTTCVSSSQFLRIGDKHRLLIILYFVGIICTQFWMWNWMEGLGKCFGSEPPLHSLLATKQNSKWSQKSVYAKELWILPVILLSSQLKRKWRWTKAEFCMSCILTNGSKTLLDRGVGKRGIPNDPAKGLRGNIFYSWVHICFYPSR